MARVTKKGAREFVVLAVVVAIASMAYGDSAISLSNGVPVTGLSGEAGTQVFYSIAVPAGQGELEISISGGTGDCDLYVRRGAPPSVWSYHYRPYRLGNDETVTVTGLVGGTWYIMLRGNAAYSDVTLVASYKGAAPTSLENGVSLEGLSGEEDSMCVYTIQVPAGQTSLEVNTWEGAGDVDLFLKHESAPTPYEADAYSCGESTQESIFISYPPAGTWYILLHGSDDYQNVSLRATYGSDRPASEGQPNVAMPNLSGAAGSETCFVFHVPNGLERISFSIRGGTGDCDMYLMRGARPTTSDYGYRPTDDGNYESVSFSGSVEGGDWYVLLVGDQAYTGVTLEVRYYYGPSIPPQDQPHHGQPPKTTPPQSKPPEGYITPLTPGVPVTDISGREDRQQYFSLEVPQGATNLVIKMSGGTGDADLYVRRGSLPTLWDYDDRPYNTGNNEQVTISKPIAGTWYLMIRGYQSFSDVTLVATFDGVKPEDVTVLVNGVPVIGLTGGPGGERFYKIEVPADQTKLEIAMSGGTGDADLYVRVGAKPTTGEWDYRPFLFGNQEMVTIDGPKAGTYYIMVRGYTSYADVTLKATYGPASNDVKALANCVAAEGLSGAQDSETFFKIDVPAGQRTLSIETFGGTGDADLYVKKGEKPTAKSWDYHPGLHGNDEAVKIENPAAATWYIMVRGYHTYSGVTLKACFQAEVQEGDGDDSDDAVIIIF